MSSHEHCFQSVLATSIIQFLSDKRALGRCFDAEEKMLWLWDRYLTQRGINHPHQISPDVIVAFLESRPRGQPGAYNHLLGAIRRLFDWLVQRGEVTSSPVSVKAKKDTNSKRPFIFDKETAARLLRLAGGLKDRSHAPMRGVTYRTIFALLYGLGLRVDEVSHLHYDDVDCNRNVLVIRETRLHKSRLVPFGPQIGAMLGDYFQARQRHVKSLAMDTPCFSFAWNRPVSPSTMRSSFHALVRQLELKVPRSTLSPRLHDLRHSFAVGTILRWYRAGIDPRSRLVQLSTFLGNVDLRTTTAYLKIAAECLREAGDCSGQLAGPAIQGE